MNTNIFGLKFLANTNVLWLTFFGENKYQCIIPNKYILKVIIIIVVKIVILYVY